MKGLPRPPFFTEDYIAMAESLPDHEFKLLFLAIMHYVKDGTVPQNLPDLLTLPFNLYRVKIDAASQKYGAICEARAQSGAKGGKAKAANAAKAQQLPPDAPFRPPNKAEFKKIIKELKGRGEAIYTPDTDTMDQLYSDLSCSDWYFRGERFRTMQELETMLICRYNSFSHPPRAFFGWIFDKIWGDFNGLRDSAGVSKVVDVVNNFCKCYNTKESTWNVHETQYPFGAWEDALDDFMTTYEP